MDKVIFTKMLLLLRDGYDDQMYYWARFQFEMHDMAHEKVKAAMYQSSPETSLRQVCVHVILPLWLKDFWELSR